MYQHCPTCTRTLGTNEALESFPVGRRLAYDLSRGRLWVLCAGCRSWNLAPIEERWEAVEEAEIRFESAAQGVSTEHMALGRLADGTELIRVGKARAAELAGWRYARRIRGRWRRSQVVGGGMTLAMVGATQLGVGAVALPAVIGVGVAHAIWHHRTSRGRGLTLPAPGSEAAGAGASGAFLAVGDLRRLQLVSRDGEGTSNGAWASPEGGLPWSLEIQRPNRAPLVIPSHLRNRALRLAMPAMNRDVGRSSQVTGALERVVEAGSSGRLVGEAARALQERKPWDRHVALPWGEISAIEHADPVLRLALEIAANDEMERLALDGELYRLELEWKEAEELAAISDGLLVPAWVRRRIAMWKTQGTDNGEG